MTIAASNRYQRGDHPSGAGVRSLRYSNRVDTHTSWQIVYVQSVAP